MTDLPSLLSPDVPPAYWWLSDSAAGSARFAQAWLLATGSGVSVSVVDRGVNHQHADLVQAYDARHDLDPRDLHDSTDASPDSSSEVHGTQVAGLISGNAFNGFGTIGAAYGSTLSGSYLRYGPELNLPELAGLMAAQRGFDVSNNSWGVPQAFADNFLLSAWMPVAAGLQTALSEGRGGLGTVFVFAAGNGRLMQNGQNIGDDANFHSLANGRHAIAVAGSTSDGELAFFSSPGANLLIAGPALGLITTDGTGAGATGQATVHGTSFAAALVSSTVALMLEANPDLGWRDVQDILALTARPDASLAATANSARGANGGGLIHSRDLGFGLLDAEAAVRLAAAWTARSTSENEVRHSVALPPVLTPDPTRHTLTFEVDPGTDGLQIDWVSLRLTVSDQDLRGLRIEVVSPSGTRSVLAENLAAAGTRSYLDFTFSAAAFRDEMATGRWTVELIHPTAARGFVVYRATLEFSGDSADADDLYVFTPSFAELAAADPDRLTVTDADGGVDTLMFAATRVPVRVDLAAGEAFLDGHRIRLVGDFEIVTGSAGADVLLGGSGDETLRGGAGDDTLSGGAGDDHIDGGAGTDTVLLAGTWADHDFEKTAAGIRVTGPQGIDHLTGIERLVFSDGQVIRLETSALPLTNASPTFTHLAVTVAATAAGLVMAQRMAPSADQLLATITADDPNLSVGDRLVFALGTEDSAAGLRVVSISATEAQIWGDPEVLAARGWAVDVAVTDLHGRSVWMRAGVPVVQDASAGIVIAEGASGALVARLTGLPSGTLSLSDARFELIDVGNGDRLVRLIDGFALDYEAESEVILHIVGDVDGALVTFEMSVIVQDVNELPGGAGGLSVWAPEAIEVGRLRASLSPAPEMIDPEGAPLTYQLVSGPKAGWLCVGPDRLFVGTILTAAEFAMLDYRVPAFAGSFTATFAVSDGSGSTALNLVITVAPASNHTLSGGAANDLLTGAAGHDVLSGQAGRDRLFGGAGNDSLFGGAGNDWLHGGKGGDLLSGGDGFDRAVYRDSPTGLIVSLAHPSQNTGFATGDTFVSVEGLSGSKGDDQLTGDAGRNELRGEGGNDTLDGGAGRDTLTGGAGADTFVFSSAPGKLNVDMITDFEPGVDRIALAASAFGGLTGGLAAAFVSGPAALDGDDRLVYDASTGTLSFDPDGTGAAHAVTFARLEPGTILSSEDLFMIA